MTKKQAVKRKKTSEQLYFDLFEMKTKQDLNQDSCRRAVIGWLAKQDPNGIGMMVPTRISKFQADVAAFWSVSRKKLLVPQKTIIVEVRNARENCWPDCGKRDELLPLLRDLKNDRTRMEKTIRETEPELREDDNLFHEFEIWNYARSCNRDYLRCRREIEAVEHALYKGSRFEQIRAAHVADLLYLAVPADSVHPHELAEGWGLLYIKPRYRVDIIREAEPRNCPEENRLHLVQNIASSSLRFLLFAHGIRLKSGGSPVFVPKPHRRRATVDA